MTVIWSWQAVAELVEIRAHLQQFDTAATRRFVERVRETTADLEQFPRLGRQGRRRGEREKPIGGTPWILVYRETAGGVEIIHIWGGRRDLPRKA